MDDQRRIAIRTVALVLFAVPFLAGCGATRPQRAPLGDGEERIIGARLAAVVRAENRSIGDPTVTEYVQTLGDRMARLSDRPGIPYTFDVIADRAPRSFALPGGYLYVSAGLLARLDSEAEVAGVLAHGLAHVAAKHPMSRLLEVMGRSGVEAILTSPRSGKVTPAMRRGLETVLAGYPRDIEREADKQGLLFTTRVALNPEGMIRAMEKVDAASGSSGAFWEGLSQAAPEQARRIEALKAEVKSIGLDAGLPYNRERYAPIKARLR
jgi:predicted Zn-dependent protease